ncbi:MAG: XTP/dITP diphosphatase [Elusimicrobiota bacterium]|jgi:XTP/dITP diphosphohydrolase
MELLLATRNANKVREISQVLLPAVPGLKLFSLEAFPDIPEVVEDGRTLQENARKKAEAVSRSSGLPCLADDTGLEVAALGGAPGVYSARYAGEGCDYAANNAKLLAELKDARGARRSACFRCVMALAVPGEETVFDEGRLDGSIRDSAAGKNGFGYDPIFLLPDSGRTLAELSAEEKNRLSHRAKALEAVARRLAAMMGRRS